MNKHEYCLNQSENVLDEISESMIHDELKNIGSNEHFNTSLEQYVLDRKDIIKGFNSLIKHIEDWSQEELYKAISIANQFTFNKKETSTVSSTSDFTHYAATLLTLCDTLTQETKR